jgi:hypothetical protein
MKMLPGDLNKAMQSPSLRAGVARETLTNIAAQLGVTMPADYVEFMMESDGAEFQLGETFVVLLSADDLVDENEASDDFPAYLKVFGGNGGSEKYAFDTRTTPNQIVVVPHYQPDDDDVLPQGTSLIGFLRRILNDEVFGEG